MARFCAWARSLAIPLPGAQSTSARHRRSVRGAGDHAIRPPAPARPHRRPTAGLAAPYPAGSTSPDS